MVKLRREVQLKHVSHLVVYCFGYLLRKCNIIMKKHIRKLAHRKGLFGKVAYLNAQFRPSPPTMAQGDTKHGNTQSRFPQYNLVYLKVLFLAPYYFLSTLTILKEMLNPILSFLLMIPCLFL